jgi:hypothetical protein
MSGAPADLTLERVNRLGREMGALADVIGSMTKMLGLRFDMQDQNLARIDGRLEGIDRRLASMEQTVKGYAGEQILLANAILNAQQEASRAHHRIDEQEGR